MSLTHAPHAPQLQSAADQPEPATAPAAPSHVVPVAGLVVGSAADRAERDADALADTVLRRLHASAPGAPAGDGTGEVHAHDPGCGHLRRSSAPTSGAVVGAAGGALDAAMSTQIASRTGGGRALPVGIRRSMEGAFGTGLSHVRIHDDSTAASLNQAVSARAFTTGSDIFFGAGQYAPHDTDGQRVLAHELAHVVTEGGGAPVRRSIFSDLFTSKTPEQKEQERKDKEAKEARKLLAEQEAERKAAAAAESKKKEKREKAELKASRAKGVAGRAALSQEIYGSEPALAATPFQGTSMIITRPTQGVASDSAVAMTALGAQFQEALGRERKTLERLALEHRQDPTWTVERIADEAYRLTWLTGPAADRLNAVRPPRETAAERLVSYIRAARTEANVRSGVTEADAQASTLGTMLPKVVELTYEKYVTALQALMAGPPVRTLEEATDEAEKTVWGTAPEKAVTNRPPRGSALDTRAILDARMRLAASPRAAQPTGIDKAEVTGEKVGGLVATGASGLGLIQSRIASKGQEKDTALDPENTGDPAYASEPLGIGATIAAAYEAAENVKTGNRSGEGPKFPKSDETKVAAGMGTVTDVFTSLADSVNGTIKFVKALKECSSAPNPRKGLAAAKAGFDGLSSLTESAKSTAKFAVLIDSTVGDSVKKVIPGLNIVTAVLSVASNAMTLADKAMRMSETNTAMLEARASDTSDKRVNVLVYPLLRVTQRYTKNLEQASWSTAVAISEVVTSIATVASAGGFGIPSAVQQGIGALNTLHSLGHVIAEEYLTHLSQKASEASVGALEGSAEELLSRNPGVAVDGIILRAAQKDPHAVAFLSNYEVDGAVVDAAMLAKVHVRGSLAGGATPQTEQDVLVKIRQAVLDEMGEGADPEYTYVTWKNKVGSTLTNLSDKWSSTGTMADHRNRMDASGAAPGTPAGKQPGGRGVLWRLKMMVKGEEKFGRSAKKTEVNWEDSVAKGSVRDTGVALVCGPFQLPTRCTEADMTTFLEGVDTLSDAVIVEAATNMENSEEGRAILIKIIQERLATAMPHAGATR
ncbi:eCIS core domain-containing protein [Sanguibacter suarezii]|uniref:eCIS core domain-containing protein n=1 Tax=Sanguibacter suarezii TaxID=60921 RepID=UPI00083637A7|nr:DUF4157 domain-containing protein [Sanguibacter suarezii]